MEPQAKRLDSTWGGGNEYVTFTFTSVAADRRAEVRDLVRSMVLPELANWLRRASTAPEGWRILSHGRSWVWSEGTLEVSGDDVP